jgi:adenylate cyclase class 2
MNYEVEQKFPVPDLTDVEKKLDALGARFEATIRQSDGYFAHPSRDFSQTDEALRIRRVGDRNYVTYKGPKIDTTTKTRREIELPLDSGESGAGQFGELLEALGFTSVAAVEKTRRTATLLYQGRSVEVALDTVDGLGTFIELELVTDEEGLVSARELLAALATELALTNPERRSYLELLLNQ